MRMNIIKSALMMGAVLGFMPVSAQGTSAPYTPGITKDAVSYWLPKTKIAVTVTTTKRTFKPGEFSRYAERYLRMSGVRDQADEVWEITGVTISAFGVPDKDNLYTMSFPDKGRRPSFELTEDGIIAAVNTHIQVESKPITPATPVSTASQTVNPQDYMTEEILMAGSTAKMAELTAKEIYNIRESRNAITRGQADFIPTDGESLKYMLESLTTQETALLTLFSGTTETREHVFTINVTPDVPITKQILFRFSTKLGVLPIDNLAGEPVWIDITDKNLVNAKAVEAPAAKGKKSSKKEPVFLYSRIPGMATIKIYNNRKSYLEQELQVAQFGKVEPVSSTIMGKNSDTKITYNTITGNILTIE
ncbi:MAG: DUF4831 family protein [Bacteroidaceae bacterium]|nr:DUF4831 family protein [Bacteroidaceae bacterium]